MANDVKEPVPRNGKAALVWLLVFVLLGSLFLFRGTSPAKMTELNQTDFEAKVVAGAVRTAKVTPGEGDVLEITGKYLLPAEEGQTPQECDYRTRVLSSARIQELLARTPSVQIEDNNNNWWNLIISILPVILVLAVIYFFTSRQIKMAGRGAMDFGKSKARMIPPDQLHVRFDDIAGADEAKEEIREIVEFLKDPLKFQLLGGKIPKGCLLVGEPGTGKTLMAKAVACEAGVPFFSISGSDFVEMFVGVGASRVRDMFEQARKNTPSLLFIDEIDAVGRSRFSGWGGGHDEREQTLNAMLVEMDGLESKTGVIVLAATNRPDVLDPALLRPGRFDRQIVMDLPDIAGRRKILEVHANKIKTDDTVNLDILARTTPGFSGADLANLCNEAALLAARHGKEQVSHAEMEEARDKVCYGRERKSRRIVERERRLTAYHEAGHTLVAMRQKHATPLHKVTIIPRGRAYLGATFMMPQEDVYTHSRQEMLASMAVSMGGRAAEELIFEDITTGASGDIENLTHTARAMVCIYGMTDHLGPIKYADMNPHPHVRIDAPPPDAMGQETAREIDLEIRRLVTNAHETAKKILSDDRELLVKLAEELLKKETLSIDEIETLLGIESAPNHREDAAVKPEESAAEPAAPAEETPGAPESAPESAPEDAVTGGEDAR
ncbi:MAG: ATP-dependent zinc metalloprotease FtsH [Lentisphaeria bacterium]|nr:ATP-dependent zinc metalloprotease FtsH [Lentisphaeria bacterium]